MSNFDKKDTWCPTPRYLCRKSIVLDFLDEIGKGTFIDIGAGSGDLVADLAKKGYKGRGIDFSDEAIKIAQKKLNGINDDVKVRKMDLFNVDKIFNIAIMLEVIEHIKEEKKALKKVYDILSEDGHLIISAPAHKKDWSVESDEWAGHYRRYEKNELRSKLENTGFKVLKLYNYGFPIANIAKPIRNYLMKKDYLSQKYEKMSTKRSGTDRNSQKKFTFLINSVTMAPFLFLQKFFFHKDFGDGYIVLVKK